MLKQFLFIFLCFTNINFAHEPLIKICKKRHSGYAYLPDQPVTKKQMNLLIEAARQAPSSHNEQPWYYIICDKNRNPEAWSKALSCLKPKNQAWVKNAPVIIITVVKKDYTMKNKPNTYAHHDTGAASMSLCLEATSLGLMAHQMGGFEEDSTIKAFDIPQGYEPFTFISVGYEDPSVKPEAKQRKPVDENFFYGAWKKH